MTYGAHLKCKIGLSLKLKETYTTILYLVCQFTYKRDLSGRLLFEK